MNAEKKCVATALLMAAIGVSAAGAAFAGKQAVTLPKGTKVKGMAAGHVLFVLPDGTKTDIRGLEIKAGAFASIEVRNAAGKVVSAGKAGRLMRSRALTKEQAVKLPPTDYVEIDDEPTWLPLVLQFEGVTQLSPQPDPPGVAPRTALSAAAMGRQSITLPKGSRADRLAAGHLIFALPDGTKAEIRGLSVKTGAFASIEVRGAGGKVVHAGKAGRLVRSRALTKEQATKLPPSDYIAIDDEPTWLPAVFEFDAIAVISPDPPGRPSETGAVVGPGTAIVNPDPPPKP